MNAQPKKLDVAAMRARFLALLGEHAEAYPENIERDFPRILEKLTDLWGSVVLVPYIDSLVFSDRPTRQGFPAEVASELFRLSNLHRTINPAKAPPATVWEETDHVDLIEGTRKSR